MRRPGSTGAASQQPALVSPIAVVNKNEQNKFNPLNSLMTTLGYGKSIWTKVNKIPVSEALPLIDLTFLLEEHIQTLIELCNLKAWYQDTECSEILNLIEFYQKEELSVQPSKWGDSLQKILLDQMTYQAPSETVHWNYLALQTKSPNTHSHVKDGKAEDITQEDNQDPDRHGEATH
jgi:hypothetical protein